MNKSATFSLKTVLRMALYVACVMNAGCDKATGDMYLVCVLHSENLLT